MTRRTDFNSQQFRRNPAAGIARLRAFGPVVEVRLPIIGRVWITTTRQLADHVLQDSKTFGLREDGGAVAGLRWWMPGILRTLANNMLTMDEPDHTRLRGIVDQAFRRRAILEMEPRILASPMGSPANCLRKGAPPILSSDTRASCHCPSSASCSVCRRPTGRSSWSGRAASHASPVSSASCACFRRLPR
jgi:hypothetical protein